MPQLVLTPRGKGKALAFPLFKKITTIGRTADNDVVLDEADRNCEVLVNGRRKKTHQLADQDNVRVGPAQLTFSLFDEVAADADAPSSDTVGEAALEAMEKLEAFSERLFGTYDIDRLLEQLM